MMVAVILPTWKRAGQFKRHVSDLLLQIPPVGVDLLLAAAVQANDEMTLKAVGELAALWRHSHDTSVITVIREPGTSCVEGFNLAYNRVRGLADWYVLGSDDQVYQVGWLAAALETAETSGAQVIGFNDGHTNINNYAPHFMMSGAFIEDYLGGFMVPPVYTSWWFDREICEIAQRAGLYAPAWEAYVDHLHPDWGTAPMDATYREAWPSHAADKMTYLARQAAGYPQDWTVNYES